MKTQKNPVGNDFDAAVLQLNLTDLYQSAHDHIVQSAFPSAKDGSAGDIKIVDTASAVYLCVKTSRGWFKSSAFIAI